MGTGGPGVKLEGHTSGGNVQTIESDFVSAVNKLQLRLRQGPHLHSRQHVSPARLEVFLSQSF